MKTEKEIRKRFVVLEDMCASADSGSERETVLMSAIDELEWVLR